MVPSSDPIEIAAVTRSQSKHKSEIDDGDTGPVTLSDETNQMLRDMDMTKFKEMQESDSSLHTLWMKAKQNDLRYCISNDLLYKRSSVVDDPGLLVLPANLRDDDLRERLKQCSELVSEHASTLQVEMEHIMTKTVARGRWRQISESLYYCLTAIIAYHLIERDRIQF